MTQVRCICMYFCRNSEVNEVRSIWNIGTGEFISDFDMVLQPSMLIVEEHLMHIISLDARAKPSDRIH